MNYNLAISNIAWGKEQDEEVYQLMKKYGFTGLEIAPTRWIPDEPYNHIPYAVKLFRNLKGIYGFDIPSMQSIWFGKKEKLFGSEKERKLLLDYTKKAIDFASQIKCNNIVFGCPQNRQIHDSGKEKMQSAISFFKELGNYAFEQGTILSIEPNPVLYNTDFINTTSEAVELVKEVSCEGFKVNLDIGTIIENSERLDIFSSNINIVNHIHISEPKLAIIKKRELHKEVEAILKNEQYGGYVSIEMAKCENIKEIEAVMYYVREIFR